MSETPRPKDRGPEDKIIEDFVRRWVLEKNVGVDLATLIEQRRTGAAKLLLRSPDLAVHPIFDPGRAVEFYDRYIEAMAAEKYLQAILKWDEGRGSDQLLQQAHQDAANDGGFTEQHLTVQEYAKKIGSPFHVLTEAIGTNPRHPGSGPISGALCEIRLGDDRKDAKIFIDIPEPGRDAFYPGGQQAIQFLLENPAKVARWDVIVTHPLLRNLGYASAARLGGVREVRYRNRDRGLPIELITLEVLASIGAEIHEGGEARRIILPKPIWNYRSIGFCNLSERCPARPLWVLQDEKPVPVFPNNDPSLPPYPHKLLTNRLVMGIYLDECRLDD